MAYDAYAQFMSAVRKFPRWTNARRRPIDSNGGKVLRSIIEEIAAVEDAIIEYKKDFFLVNYIGREEEIMDYLYVAHVGDIEDLDVFATVNPSLLVTDDKEIFYNDHTYAYYKDGYLLMWETNDENRLEYLYNGYTSYFAEITEQHIWNVIDEFAWWCGLERFSEERNASLLQRCLYQLHYDEDNHDLNRRPNSTEKGLKNTIRNAASVLSSLSEDEIKFLEPNEKTLAIKNDDGITLYEQISRFNRDIARTRQWDIDYWDNNFRKLYYLPHVWDAEVDSYKNGVGYMDSLFVSTAKEMNVEGTVDLTVNGYKKSKTKIENYVQSNNIAKNIPLTLVHYSDMINPLQIQYKIEAEDVIHVTDPSQIWFDLYKHYVGLQEYKIDDFVDHYDSRIYADNTKKNLEPNTQYKLEFRSKDDNISRMEIDSCILYDGTTPLNKVLLVEDQNHIFGFYKGKFIEKNVWKHATTIDGISKPVNIETSHNGGLILTKPLIEASFQVSLEHFLQDVSRNFHMPVHDGFQYITSVPQYVEAFGYTKTADETGWVSSNSDTDYTDSITITLPGCSCLMFDTDQQDQEGGAQISVYINNVLSKQYSSLEYLHLGNTVEINFDQCYSNVKVVIKRTDGSKGFTIRNIRYSAYDINLTLYKINGESEEVVQDNIRLIKDETTLPQVSDAECWLQCTIKNYSSVSPWIEYVHVGTQTKGQVYTTPTFNTNGLTDPKIEINTNCKVALYKNNELVDPDFFTYNKYSSTDPNAKPAIYLDLSDFKEIYSSTPTLKKYRDSIYTILVDPDKPISTITIDGDGYSHIGRITLKEQLGLMNEKLYLARSAEGFIVCDTQQYIDPIQYSEINSCDRIVVRSSIYNTIQSCFVVNGKDVLTNDISGEFSRFYMYPYNVQTYIAYDTKDAVSEYTETSIPEKFLPERPVNKILYYRICDIVPDNNHVGADMYFMPGKRNWTTDRTEKIQVKVSDFGNITKDAIYSDKLNINPSFYLSNTISLRGLRDDKNNILDLGLYNVTAPNNIDIEYSDPIEFCQSTYPDGGSLRIEDDGFNKLKYANIVRIEKIVMADNSILPVGNYRLLSEPGIIIWNVPDSLRGRAISEIVYTYKQAEALRYKDINSLYDLVGYEIDAMEHVNSRTYEIKEVKDGDTISVDYSYFKTKPDMIAVTCKDNPYYIAQESNGIITVSKIADDQNPVIHNGYYYIDGREYYYFANYKDEKAKRVDGVDIENGEIINNILLLKQYAVNYLENSRMDRNVMDIHCMVDFQYPKNITNAEPLGHIGACESFAAWHDYAMNRSLTKYKNGYATTFTAKDNGYALLDITQALKNHTTISCMYFGNLKFSLGREIRILEEQALKSVFCEKIGSFTVFDDIAYLINTEIDTQQYRYYLIIEGSGILDEILIHDAQDQQDIKKWHIKGIDVLGLITEEKENALKEVDLEYSSDFMSYFDLETRPDGYLWPGTTVDWNITRLKDANLEKVLTKGFLFRNEVWIAEANNAFIETKPIEVKYARSIYKMAFKINDLIQDNFEGFNIKVFASSSYDGAYSQITEVKNTNVVSFMISPMQTYLKFRIEANEGKIVRQIDLFAIYKEDSGENLSIFYNMQGSAVTKVLDIGAKATYKFKEVLASEDSEWGAIYIRAAKESTSQELIWTTWQNTEAAPEFNGYQLFQFKIIMNRQQQRAKIHGFRFEVLANV